MPDSSPTTPTCTSLAIDKPVLDRRDPAGGDPRAAGVRALRLGRADGRAGAGRPPARRFSGEARPGANRSTQSARSCLCWAFVELKATSLGRERVPTQERARRVARAPTTASASPAPRPQLVMASYRRALATLDVVARVIAGAVPRLLPRSSSVNTNGPAWRSTRRALVVRRRCPGFPSVPLSLDLRVAGSGRGTHPRGLSCGAAETGGSVGRVSPVGSEGDFC